MDEETFSVVNDAVLTVHGVIARPKPRGKFPLLVIAGGFFDTVKSASVKEFTRIFLENGFAVCTFDFTDSFGKSEGRAADMTISQRVRDLEHVVQYCKRRAYVNDHKVSILGIGLGAMASLVLEAFNSMVHALVLVNTPVGVDKISWTIFSEREMFRIRLKRYFHVHLKGSPALINYTFFEDGQKLDMARCARNLKTPVVFIAGEENEVVAQDQSEWLYERTTGKKELQILPGVGAIDGRKGVKAITTVAIAFLKKQKVA